MINRNESEIFPLKEFDIVWHVVGAKSAIKLFSTKNFVNFINFKS